MCLAFESVIHMGEETRNAKIAVPRSVFWALVGNMTLDFIMLVTFIVREMVSVPARNLP